MSKIFGVVSISVIHLLFISPVTSANDATAFNYFFSDEFYNEENPVFYGFRQKTHGFIILEGNASIMCKNQVLFYREDQDNEVPPDKSAGKPAGKIEDIDNFDFRDLTIFNKDRFFKKFFPDIKTLFGNLKISDGSHLIDAPFKFTQDTLPALTSNRVTPSSGTPDDTYTFQVKFSDADNDPPASVKLFIDGAERHDFSVSSAYQQAVHIFSYSLTGFDYGAHYYEFTATQGDWEQTLSGSFMVNRPSDSHFAVKAIPSTVQVDGNNNTTITALLKDADGAPFPAETITFSTNFPGYFTPSSGKAVTNSDGLADITFTPATNGRAIITATAPYGSPVSTIITCTLSAVSISFEFLPAGPTSYNVKSFINNVSNNQPVADSPVQWSLKPSTDCSWTDDPDSKTDTNGKAEGCFNVSKPTRVSVTVTHIPSGISGSGTFTFKGYGGTKILPWKNLEGAGELCEWSSNGYFAVRQASGLSIYRVSDWEKVYSKNKGFGSYHGLIFSPDGSRLVTDDFNGKGDIAVLNVPDGSIDRSWDVGCKTKAADRSFGWRGNYIYAVHNDNLIRKWSNPGALNTTFNHNDEIRELRFNPANDSQFAAVDNYGELRIWNTESPSPVRTIDVESGSTVNLECLAWSHDGTNLSVGTVNSDTGVIYTYNTLSWSKSGFTLPGLGTVNSLDYNNDSSLLAIGHSNGLIVYNLNTYTVEYYNSGSVKHVRWSPASWSPDGCMLAAGGQIYVFDDYSGPQIRIFSPESGSFVTSASVEIVGKISDPHDIRSATVSVNQGAPVALSLEIDGLFTQTVSLIEGRNTILIQAQDIPENESSYTLIVNRFADALPPVLTEPYVDSVIRLNGTGSYDFGTAEKAGVTKEPEKDKTATLSKTAEIEKSLTIQVAAFNDQKLAERMVKELKKKGYPAYRIIGKTPGKVIWHKVRIGYFKNRAEAERTLSSLKKDKIKAIIVGSKKM